MTIYRLCKIIFSSEVYDLVVVLLILWNKLSFWINLQELEKLSQKFEENILDSTKQFEKLITDKKEIEGLPATALAMAAEMALSKVYHVKIFLYDITFLY